MSPAADGLPTPRRYWAILAIALGITMSVLDSSIANVALPTIARDLDASPAASIWIVNAYQVALVISLLPLAALGDLVGYRRVSQAGLALFTLASLACAMSDSLWTLSLSRVLQGFGAAGIMSVNGAIVRFTYPHRMLGRAVGINAMVVSIAAAAGPTLAASILAVGHWRWLFGINIPIGLVAIVIANRSLPFNESSGQRLNPVSVLLNATTFGLLITGGQTLTHKGADVFAWAQIAAGALAGVFLMLHERHRDAPLIPFDLLRIPLFSLSVLTSIASFTGQMLAFVSLPFFLQDTLGFSAVETGLLMTPWPLAVAVAAPLAGRLADRYPVGILGSSGLVTFAAGLAALALLPAHPSVPDIIWRMALCGLGFGFFQSPNNRALLGSATRTRAGAAGGMLGMARLTGQTTGALAVALCINALPHTGFRVSLMLAVAVALLAAVLSSLRLIKRRTPVPQQTAETACAATGEPAE